MSSLTAHQVDVRSRLTNATGELLVMLAPLPEHDYEYTGEVLHYLRTTFARQAQAARDIAQEAVGKAVGSKDVDWQDLCGLAIVYPVALRSIPRGAEEDAMAEACEFVVWIRQLLENTLARLGVDPFKGGD